MQIPLVQAPMPHRRNKHNSLSIPNEILIKTVFHRSLISYKNFLKDIIIVPYSLHNIEFMYVCRHTNANFTTFLSYESGMTKCCAPDNHFKQLEQMFVHRPSYRSNVMPHQHVPVM